MHIPNNKEQMDTKQAFNWYLPMMSHIDSQDDKILPEHPKFNPKFKYLL